MNIEDIREYCLTKQQVSEELPFGPDTLVFKVCGKVFLLVGLDQVESLSFNVKCDPDVAIELRLNYSETVIPGYHMNKKHWNTVKINQDVKDTQLKQWIKDSYNLVILTLSKSKRPELLND